MVSEIHWQLPMSRPNAQYHQWKDSPHLQLSKITKYKIITLDFPYCFTYFINIFLAKWKAFSCHFVCTKYSVQVWRSVWVSEERIYWFFSNIKSSPQLFIVDIWLSYYFCDFSAFDIYIFIKLHYIRSACWFSIKTNSISRKNGR